MSAMLGVTLDWVELREFLPPASQVEWSDERLRRSALASSFVAALELARQGRVEIMQDHVFGPLRLRSLNA
jgi:segregation and condensation protein A